MSSALFANLNKKEKEIVVKFSQDTNNADPVLKMVLRLFAHFIIAKKSNQRELYRRKLFDLAGLMCIIPVKELYSAIPSLDITINANISDKLLDYSNGEFSVDAFLNSPYFVKFANLNVDVNETFKSLLQKQDRSGIACIRSIKFLPTLTAFDKSCCDLSASSESFTRTILIASYYQESMRDVISIMYDMVQQADFLFHVQSETDVVVAEIAKIRMNVRSCIFAFEVFDLLYENSFNNAELKIEEGKLVVIMANERSLATKSYLDYIKTELIDSAQNRIFQCCKSDQALASAVWSKVLSVKNFHALKID